MDSPHPDILAETDLDMILKSGAHFARKLDDRIDEELLVRIDADVHGLDSRQPG